MFDIYIDWEEVREIAGKVLRGLGWCLFAAVGAVYVWCIMAEDLAYTINVHYWPF